MVAAVELVGVLVVVVVVVRASGCQVENRGVWIAVLGLYLYQLGSIYHDTGVIDCAQIDIKAQSPVKHTRLHSNFTAMDSAQWYSNGA